MAIAEDASTPAVATATANSTGTITTASFTPPSNSLLVVMVNIGYASAGSGIASVAISDTASGSYTAGPFLGDSAADNSGIWFRYLSSSPGAITVTATNSNHPAAGYQLAVRVLTGAAPSQAGAASATHTGSPATTAVTSAITTTATGSAVYVAACGNSGDTFTAAAATTLISNLTDATDAEVLGAGRATSLTGTPGATTLGFTSSGSLKFSWVALEILPASSPGTPGPPVYPLRSPVRAQLPHLRPRARGGRVASNRGGPVSNPPATPTVVNQWAGTFSQPVSFGTTPPALESAVVALTPSASVGGGSGTPTAGSWLFCLVSMNESATAPGFTVGVGDDVRSFWRPGDETSSTWAVSTPSGLTRAAVWYTPNTASAPGSVYVAPNGCFDALAVLVIEVAGLGPWDTVTGISTNYAAAATTLALSLGAPSGQAFIVGATAGDNTTAGQALAPGGWTALHTVSATNGSDHTSDAVLTAAVITTSGSVSVSGTASSATDLSGVLIGVLTSAPSPVPAANNPAWPYLKFEAALGGGFETPPDQLTWTDLTSRLWSWSETTGIQYQLGDVQATELNLELDNLDGALSADQVAPSGPWSFTASGTPATGSYFTVTTAQAAGISAQDGFTDTSNPGTLFTVTSLSAPSGGFVNVTFTPSATAVMASPDVVTQVNPVTGTPVRIRAALGTLGGVTSDRWYVIQRNTEQWTQEIGPDYRRRIAATATDIWSVLSSSGPSPYRGEVYQDSPYAWWPMDDQALSGGVQPTSLRNAALGNTNALLVEPASAGVAIGDAYSTSGTDLTTDGSVVTGLPPGNPAPSVAVYAVGQDAGWMYGDPASSPSSSATGNPVTASPGSAAWQQTGLQGNSGSNSWFLAVNDAGFPALSSGITFSVWFNAAFYATAKGFTDTGSTHYNVAGQPYNGTITLATLATASAPVMIIQLNSSGSLILTTYNGGSGTNHTIYSSSDLRNAAWNQVTVTATTSAWAAYVNGGLTATATGTGAGMTSAWTWLAVNADFGSAGGSSLGSNAHGGNVAYSHAQVFPSRLPAWRILAHYCAAVTGFGLLPAPQAVAVSPVLNRFAGTSYTPDGSEFNGSYGVSAGKVTSYGFSALAVSQAGSYHSGPAARTTTCALGANQTTIFGAAVWVGWTALAPAVAVYTDSEANTETNAATCCGSGDAFTSGYGSGASGGGVCQTAGGTGAAYPTSPSALGDTVQQRLERVLGYGNVTYPGRCIDPASLQVQAGLDIGGQQTGANLTNITQSDGGLLFIDNLGNLTYWQKSHLASQYSSPVWTLTPSAPPAPGAPLTAVPYYRDGFEWPSDPQRVWNAILITPYSPDGSSLADITPGDATGVNASQQQYGAQPRQITSYLQSQAEMQNQADFLFSNYGQAQMRVDGVKVDAAPYPAAFSLVLGVNIGDIVTVANWQIGGGGATGTFRVSNIRRTISFGGDDEEDMPKAEVVLQCDYEPTSWWT